MSATKLNWKIIKVGSTNKSNNQMPDGASNTKGCSQFGCGRCNSSILEISLF
jgi:hypothetical protein